MKKELLFVALTSAATQVLSQHNPYIEAVDEYCPAPGQFVNELPKYEAGDNKVTMSQKCTEAIAQNAGGLITLGGWGGYVTFHFDHAVINVPDAYDIYIAGNATTASSEAGIVMVSQDENHNGLPDDTWYELSGSADVDSANVTYSYSLTYTRSGELQDVAWQDNQGNVGYITRNSFHAQEYYPLWLPDVISFNGTRLPDNAHDTSGTGRYWVLDPLRYGYVDNLPNSDQKACSFDISWAVDIVSRTPVRLDYIDFVRVYTGLNQSAGWLGETSTEVSGSIDLHPEATLGLNVVSQDDKREPAYYDLMGRKITNDKTNRILIKYYKPIN